LFPFRDYPIILLAASPLSRMIIPDVDKSVRSLFHLRKTAILADFRQKYWNICANTLIKELVSGCVVSRRRAKSLQQKMDDLPSEEENKC